MVTSIAKVGIRRSNLKLVHELSQTQSLFRLFYQAALSKESRYQTLFYKLTFFDYFSPSEK